MATVPRTEKEQPPPEATQGEVEKIKEDRAKQKAEREAFLATLEPAQQKRIAEYHKKNKPVGETAKKGLQNFLTYSVKQLEDAKGNKTLLEKLLQNHRENQNKKVLANPPKDHTFEDYNIEYILSLLNR